MNIFHHHLKSIKTPSFRYLNFWHETLSQIFHNYAIRSSKKCKNHLDEILFILREFGPILDILPQINFFSRPEAGLMLFVHAPYIIVLDGENDKSIRVFLEQRLYYLRWFLVLRWVIIGCAFQRVKCLGINLSIIWHHIHNLILITIISWRFHIKVSKWVSVQKRRRKCRSMKKIIFSVWIYQNRKLNKWVN